MSDVVISVENLSKQYRLGTIGGRTLHSDISRGWARLRGRPDPTLKIGQEDHANRRGEILWALRDVSFEVKQGEALGIIGRNGAGKSTLLKILSRITAPTSGRVKIKGRIGSLLEVGTGFHPELTGRENIYLNGAIMGMKSAEIARKFDEIVDFSGVEKFIDTPVKRYSSGMYVRLAFAVAAHLEPEILVIDEVLAVGDADFQKKCLGKMDEVAKHGRTVLFVSHNMTAISNLCRRAIVLRDGGVWADSEAHRAIRGYLDSTGASSHATSIGEQIKILADDAIFRLTSFCVTQNGQPRTDFTTGASLEVVMVYEVLQTTTDLRVGFDLVDSATGEVVFRTFSDDIDNKRGQTLPGHYEATATIPSCFLAPTSYFINVVAGVHNVRWIIKDQLRYQFRMVNLSELNAAYADSRPGVVMPKINWMTVASAELSPSLNLLRGAPCQSVESVRSASTDIDMEV